MPFSATRCGSRRWWTLPPDLDRLGRTLVSVSDDEPIVDPVLKPHLAAVDPAFREWILEDIERCRALLDYLRDH